MIGQLLDPSGNIGALNPSTGSSGVSMTILATGIGGHMLW